ncbi:MAG: diguanylate cyclase [Tenericutes bacterium]|nr:diguanylate cyclase [Mycoplasmatota bacterium]
MSFLQEFLLIFTDLLNNAILLFGLGFVYAATNIDQNTNKAIKKIFLGVAIGAISVLIMLNPWTHSEGLIFDTRSVLFSVTGLFFGGLTTGIAVLIGVIFRVSLGGSGVYAGVLTITLTSLIGLYWHKIKIRLPKMRASIEFYVFGLIVHVVTLLCFLAIPWPTSIEVIKSTVIPFLVFFPLIVVLLSKIVSNQKERIISQQKIKNQQLLLQASIDATKAMEVFALDRDYNYLSFNEYHAVSMMEYYGKKIKQNENYLDYITHPSMRSRIQSCVNRALLGKAETVISEVESSKGKFLEEHYAPIIDDDGSVIGVTVFSQDISERKRYEQSILYLSYRDPLTNLYNRRYYNEEVDRLDREEFYPLSIVIADINGLKIMNDAFGHDAGDLLLCKVSDDLVKVFKNDNKVARVGGDEFVILLPNTSREEALQLIDEAKSMIESSRIHDMTISVSFGLATKDSEELVGEIIKLAEDDMYTHKLFEVASHRNETIKTILKTLHEKNPREEKHSERVSKICTKIGKQLGMNSDEINMLKAISNLHDIGKIAIDEAILNKPGKLDDKEWDAIKKHPEIGYRILAATPEYVEIAQDILSHHERYDGKGYPRGLKGEDIPLRARIISIADSYDAMISERPYRRPLTHQEAIEEIRVNLGTQFDPKLGEMFIKLFAESRDL